MNLHQKLQPHHHVAIWAVCGLLVILSAVSYANAFITQSLAQQSGPSEQTKQFFGENGDSGPGNFKEPQACIDDQTRQQQLQQQMQGLNSQMNQLQTQMSSPNLTPDQQSSLRQQMNSLHDQSVSLQSQMQASPSGPSDACKQALVEQMKTQMFTMQSKMKSHIALLDKVDSIVAKIQTDSDSLKGSLTPDQIAKIQSDINNVKTQVSTLRDFFNKMMSFMNGFLDQANSSAGAGFDYMQNKKPFSDAQFSNFSSAADSMINSFNDLQTIFSQIGGATK